MDSRIATVAIVVEDIRSSALINDILHEYGGYIVGRMGLPYRERGVSIINVVLDAPTDIISALSGRLGMLPGVRAKSIVSKK